MVAHEASEKSAAANVEVLVQRNVFLFSAASNFRCFGSNVESPACFAFSKSRGWKVAGSRELFN
jgi:hypothetical protein